MCIKHIFIKLAVHRAVQHVYKFTKMYQYKMKFYLCSTDSMQMSHSVESSQNTYMYIVSPNFA